MSGSFPTHAGTPPSNARIESLVEVRALGNATTARGERGLSLAVLCELAFVEPALTQSLGRGDDATSASIRLQSRTRSMLAAKLLAELRAANAQRHASALAIQARGRSLPARR